MTRRLAVAVICAIGALAARAGEETNRAAGGSTEELRAVLDLDGQQAGRVAQFLRDADGELQRMRDSSRGPLSIEQLVGWQDALRKRVRDSLNPNQQSAYDAWLEVKLRLSEEYDRALFGLPVEAELKIKLGFSAETLDRIHGISKKALADIREKMLELRAAGRPMSEIGDAVNELRKTAIQEMAKATAAGTEQRKFGEYLKTWTKVPAEKLPRSELDRMDRVLKGLDLGDTALGDRVKTLVAAVMWHQEENAQLRRSLAKELIGTLLQKKPEAEVWRSLYEYGALVDIHNRRIKALRDDLKAMLPTKQIAKLVTEGILE